MAEAATIPTTNPKQLGKQLRAVRRRKGLSLSEVARGAGLSRRELVAYERGKVPIPESDLWVLAGSCGVDVSELIPEHGTLELEAGPESIGDTIAFLRRGQQNGSGRAVLALEAADQPAPVYSGPQAAAAPAPAMPEPPEPFFAADGFASAPFATAPATDEPTTATPVDVFEELARLPEPVALTNDPHDYPDMLAPPSFVTADAPVESAMAEAVPYTAVLGESGLIDSGTFDSAIAPPEGTVELVDDEPFAMPTSASVTDVQAPGYSGFDAPTVVDPAPEPVDRSWAPADAPPIDVALRGETFTPPAWTTDWDPDGRPAWETPDWESATSGVWNEPDTTSATSGAPEWPADAAQSDVEVIALTSYGDLRDLPPLATTTTTEPDQMQWAHEPDPEATSTGFLVDWGDPDAPVTPRPEWRTRGTFDTAVPEIEAATDADIGTDTATDIATETLDHEVGEVAAWEPTNESTWPVPGTDDVDSPDEGDDLAPISWRPGEAVVETAIVETAIVETAFVETAFVETAFVETASEELTTEETTIEPVTAPAAPTDHRDDPSPEQWITADDDWELGNALPLVEVRGQGALVMRRADERWALANVSVSGRYLVEVDLEFRAGPGFGVLFRADVDDEGRMSAYSFDVDPVYEGGGYLVRQWQADRELWNPIAHVAAADPTTMYGTVTVRLDVSDERMVASVNDTIVMTIDDLEQGSVERGRAAPTGQRVGVQAWSSSDLVIETLRVADR